MSANSCRSWSVILVVATIATAAHIASAADADDEDDGPAKPISELIVTARRLDAARADIDPSLGASTYSLSGEMVDNRPGSESLNINHILLQAPGVMQDGSGQLRVRQSHGDLQYRINNVIIPEGVSDLGESLSARIAQSVELVTGALPAQYGFQAGGVVNITTKNGAYLDGGQLEVYGGGRGEIEPAFEYGTNFGPTNIFVSGSFHTNDAGLASRDGSRSPMHDHSDQADGFAFFDHVFNDSMRTSVILGFSDDRFQIPNLAGLDAATQPAAPGFQRPLNVNGTTHFASDNLDDRRREASRYAIASLMGTGDDLTVQGALFFRDARIAERADGVGDLLFNGFARSINTSDTAYGLQVEAVYDLSETHTLRGGVVAGWNRRSEDRQSFVLAVDATGRQMTTRPLVFRETDRLDTRKASVFGQDEWKPLSDVTVNLGLRFDDVDAVRDENRLSPRVNVVWAADGRITMHAGYARYFLPVPPDNSTPRLFAGTTGASPTFQGNALQSEIDDYYDVGVNWKADELILGIDGYWREARHFIADGVFGLAAFPATFNYDRARIRGVEFTATYSEGPLTAWANFAVAQGRGQGIVSNQFYFTSAQLNALAADAVPLSHDQIYTASGGLSYRWGALRVIADTLIGSGLPSARGGINNAHLAAYAQVNVALRYTIDSFNDRPLDLRIDVMNVFDARYQLRDGTGLGDGLPQWGPRRGIFAGVEQSF